MTVTRILEIPFLLHFSLFASAQSSLGKFEPVTIPQGIWSPNKTYYGLRSIVACAAKTTSLGLCQFQYDQDEGFCAIGSTDLDLNGYGPYIDVYSRVDFSWNTWASWSACSATFGSGNMTRSRTCANGGCCQGETFEIEFCSTCPVAGQWSAWTAWSACSVTCGSGSTARSRNCSTNCCLGESGEVKPCHLCPGNNTLIVVGGIVDSGSSIRSVEIINLDQANSIPCGTATLYPYAVRGTVGTFVNFPRICGGSGNGAIQNDCYYYNSGSQTWVATTQLQVPRSGASALWVPTAGGDKWWVTGGDTVGGSTLASTERLIGGTGFSNYGVNLPVAAYYHNLILINATTVIMVGASTSATPRYVNVNNGNSQLLPAPLFTTTNGGLVTYPDGSQDVVVISSSGTQMFSLTTFVWRLGPSMPVDSARVVPYGNTFLVVGGSNNGNVVRSIYMFDVTTVSWTLLPQQLATARSYHATFLIPDSYC